MAEAAGTILAQCFYNGGWVDYGNAAAYAGKDSDSYFPYILQFKTPKFAGKPEKLTITLNIARGGTAVTSPELRYALCTSDENREAYVDTSKAVSDSHQLTTGTYTFADTSTMVQDYALTMDAAGLQPETTYYLFLWATLTSSHFITVNTADQHGALLQYSEGILYVRGSDGWQACQAYVQDGSGWTLYLPYVYTAEGWQLCA